MGQKIIKKKKMIDKSWASSELSGGLVLAFSRNYVAGYISNTKLVTIWRN